VLIYEHGLKSVHVKPRVFYPVYEYSIPMLGMKMLNIFVPTLIWYMWCTQTLFGKNIFVHNNNCLAISVCPLGIYLFGRAIILQFESFGEVLSLKLAMRIPRLCFNMILSFTLLLNDIF